MSTSFFAELKRRNVIRVAIAYVAVGWLVLQAGALISQALDLPGVVLKVLLVLGVIGFIPVLVFSWIYEMTPEGLKRESEVEPHESITHLTGRKLDYLVIGVLVAIVALLLVDKFALAPRRAATQQASDAQQAAPGTAQTVSEKSIAVLPLANASDDKEQQYFSDGLSENLIVALSQFEGLAVIGRNSSFQFRDSKEDSKTIGAKLGVAHLLEGSVQRAGDVVRITAELISTANGHTLWSQRYDRPYQDLFKLQDEITNAVASALKAKLLTNSAAPAWTDRPPSGNLEAYNAYLQGKFYYARGTEADYRTATQQFETATRLDPRYALAWADLSRTLSGLAAQHLSGAEARDKYARARATVATALELEPGSPAAHWARGYLLATSDFDWAGAEAEYRRALELAPNDGRGKYELARLTSILGRIDEAVVLSRAALASDPLAARWHARHSVYLTAEGRLDEARQAVRKAIELQPLSVTPHYFLAIIEVLSGDAAAALAAAEAEPPGVWHDAAMAVALQAGSDRAAADAALKRLIDTQADRGAFQIAEVYAARKDPDKVFEWLDRAWDIRDPGIQSLLSHALLVAYKDDPRFAAFCRKVGLPTTTTAKVQRIPDAKAGKA